MDTGVPGTDEIRVDAEFIGDQTIVVPDTFDSRRIALVSGDTATVDGGPWRRQIDAHERQSFSYPGN
jgi:hypothetical protein